MTPTSIMIAKVCWIAGTALIANFALQKADRAETDLIARNAHIRAVGLFAIAIALAVSL